MDPAGCDLGYAAEVVRGDAPVPVLAAGDDEPVEREQRRAATRVITHPAPVGLLPAAAIDGKLLHGTRTVTGQVFLVAVIAHDQAVILGQRQAPTALWERGRWVKVRGWTRGHLVRRLTGPPRTPGWQSVRRCSRRRIRAPRMPARCEWRVCRGRRSELRRSSRFRVPIRTYCVPGACP